MIRSKHNRLLAVPAHGHRTYTDWDEQHKVPVEQLEEGETGTWGLVVGEKILDGYSPGLVFCTCKVLVLSILTCGIYYCIARCQFDHCAVIVRQYFLLTDRRLIKYTLTTIGAKSVPDLEENEGSKTQFEVMILSYMLTTFRTFRWIEDENPLTCFGCPRWCCCTRRYYITAHTSFGVVVIDDHGRVRACRPRRSG